MATFPYNQTADQDALIDQVEYHADMVTATDQTIGINRESTYDQLVKAMRAIFNVAPRRAIDDASADGSGQAATNSHNYTEIPLPDDFSRFLNLRLQEWKRDVYQMVDPRSNRVRLQYNEHTSADLYNPVVAKVAKPSSASGRTIRCWPQDSGPSIDSFAYLPEKAPEDAPEILKEAIILQATSYVLSAQKEKGWQLARQAAREIISQIRVGEQPMVQRAYQEVQEED